MPGGKVVAFEGILPKTLTESGMAVVMGHEIAHAVARHSGERLSQQMILQYGEARWQAYFFLKCKSGAVQQGIGALYGIGAQLGVLLPCSRKQEYEADKLGLIFMAMAGYNPTDALSFWQRMSADKSGSVSDFNEHSPFGRKTNCACRKNFLLQ